MQLDLRRLEYYYLAMRAKKHYFLNWLLITVIVMMPLRSVLAFDLSECQTQHEQSQVMVDHSHHMMSETVQADSGNSHKCCNDKGKLCNNDCTSMMNMSFVIQSSSLIENHYHSVLTAQTTIDVILRALPPLEKPPAYLHS